MTRTANFSVDDLRDHGETAAFHELLHTDCEVAIAHFAALYSSRTINDPVTENPALCGAADVLSRNLLSNCHTEVDGRVSWAGYTSYVRDGIGEVLWEVVMSSELPMVLVGIVSDPKFYEEEDVMFYHFRQA